MLMVTIGGGIMKYNMAIYYNKKVIYQNVVEAVDFEQAKVRIWDDFEQTAYADIHYHPCGGCAYYGDCTANPKECIYSYIKEDD